MMMKIIAFLTVITLLFCHSVSFGNESIHGHAEQNDTQEAVSDAMRQMLDEDGLTGMTYSVFRSSGNILSGGVGSVFEDVTLAPDPSKNLFRLASVSKMFTAIGVASLIDKGYFSLETKLVDLTKVDFVNKIMSRCPMVVFDRWRRVTVLHLLAHQAGISKDVPGVKLFWDTKSLEDGAYPSNDEFEKNLCKIEHLFEPGHIPVGVKYSNLAFNLLSQVVRAYSPYRNFQSHIKKLVFDNLNLEKTYYRIPLSQAPNLVSGYSAPITSLSGVLELRSVPKVLRPLFYEGSIGVASTAHDMATFGAEILKWTTERKNSFGLNHQSLLKFIEPTTSFISSLGLAKGFIWSYFPGESGGDPLWYGHTGTGVGEILLLYVSPELDVGVALQFNNRNAPKNKYAKKIIEILNSKKSFMKNKNLHPKSQNLLSRVRKFLKDTPSLVPLEPPVVGLFGSEHPLYKYTGLYVSDVTGTYDISISTNENLMISNGLMMGKGFELRTEDIEKGEFRFPAEAGIYFSNEPLKFEFDRNRNVISGSIQHVKEIIKLYQQ